MFVLGLACAGLLSAGVVAGTLTTGTTSTTGATTTSTVPTTTTPTTTQVEPVLIPSGVKIGGVAVGGLASDEAYEAVRASFERPLTLRTGRGRLAAPPARLGAVAYIRTAIARARIAAPGAAVKLVVSVQGKTVRSYVSVIARRFDRKAVDSRLTLRAFRPFITKEVKGRALDQGGSVSAIVKALKAHKRGPLRLRLREFSPAVTRTSFGQIVVVRRGSNRLYLYSGMRFRRVFGVATGQATYPTPIGRFSIVVKWSNPWWYPPASDWARDKKPIPPGPGNPLGTRWMGLTAPLVGIHGTPDAASIGYSVSHGCIRMRISDAEWLFNQVNVGTPVYIVSA